MERLRVRSTEIKNLEVGRNCATVTFEGKPLLYERVGNSIHRGTSKQIKDIASDIESVDYKPTFVVGNVKQELESEKNKSLILSISERCNMNCGYCINSEIYPQSRNKTELDMEWPVARKAIDLFLEDSEKAPKITFYGGESTMNYAVIKKCLSYARSKNPKVEFFLCTNGVGISRFMDDLIEYGIELQISIDGLPHIHDKYRRTTNDRPTYDLISSEIEEIRKRHPKYARNNIYLAATYWDLEDFAPIVERFIELDDQFAGMNITPVKAYGMAEETSIDHQSNHAIFDDLVKFGKIYVDSMVEGKAPPKILKALFDKKMRTMLALSQDIAPEQITLFGQCAPGRDFLFVDTKGVITTCEKMDGRYPLGSVDNGISINSQVGVFDVLNKSRNEICIDCWAARICSICIDDTSGSDTNTQNLRKRCPNYQADAIVGLIVATDLLERDINKNYIKLLNKEEGGDKN